MRGIDISEVISLVQRPLLAVGMAVLVVTAGIGGSLISVATVSQPVSAQSSPTLTVEKKSVTAGEETTLNITIAEVPNGLSGYSIVLNIAEPKQANFTSVNYSDANLLGLSYPSDPPQDSVQLQAIDPNDLIKPGATNVTLATVTVRGTELGATSIGVDVTYINDDSYSGIEPAISQGNLSVTAGNRLVPTSGTAELDGDGGDGVREVHVHQSDDPANTGRDGVVHLTSHGSNAYDNNYDVSDYALTIVDTPDQRLTDDTSLTFDYYPGPNDSDLHPPDEVWLVLEEPDGTRHVVTGTSAYEPSAGDNTTQQWQTANVTPNLTDSPTLWREVPVQEPISSDQAMGLDFDKLRPTVVGTNLTAAYEEDINIIAVGVGRGSTYVGPRFMVADIYVDDLKINGTNYDFPAASVTVSPSPLSLNESGTVSATIDLEGYWGGNTVSDIEANNVTLDGTSAINNSGTVADTDGDGVNELQVEFNRSSVEANLTAGSNRSLTVRGVFRDRQTVFSGTDHINVTS